MMDRQPRSNYSTRNHGPINDTRDSSTLARMQERYWATKQAVFKKLGKKDDDCIIASDSELDAKLELFQNIEESFLTLMRVLENYQERLCAFAQEENSMGRFLKENGKHDKTRAGKIMVSSGKALSYSAQQKLSLRMPLIRLYQEVETFQYRAIVDTLQTVEKMEKARTAYRGALMWMKDSSQQLDPDTCKQLEKFRKVQSHVRKSKMRFDKLKLDTLQKVDLLSFSRCNLFSQALATYQNTFVSMCKKVAQTMDTVAETTKGYQHYEFSLLKDLTETSKNLAEKTSINQNVLPNDDRDALLFFESEYHDDVDDKVKDKEKEKNESDSVINNSGPQKKKSKKKKAKDPKDSEDRNCESPLLNLDDINDNFESMLKEFPVPPRHSEAEKGTLIKNSPNTKDLLTESIVSDADKSDLELLSEILGTNNDCSSENGFDSQWQAASSQDESQSSSQLLEKSDTKQSNKACFLPSQLLDMSIGLKKLNTKESSTTESSQFPSVSKHTNDSSLKSTEKSAKGKQDMSSWFNLFADLDPLANPDLIGKKVELDDRNC